MSSTWYFMYLLTHIFLFFFSYTSHLSLIILYFLFFSSYSSHTVLFFSSNYFLLIFIFLHFKLYVLLQTCILISKHKIPEKSQFEKKSVNKGNLAIWLKCFKTMQLENTPG
jgi:hypothetical protein